ncbi:MAG: SDR family NAD(P)-dependent oxidoreductase [bacterium]|nr:SDR family NAD(P)-dependent oxidoreductase [bacterium]MDY2650264.1 SDR family NAD(P)-dependent oxidoreductase [Candidatus Egerieousia sp.]
MGSCCRTRALESRRAIVMGATSGLGREIALELLKRGFIVGVCGRRLELLQEVEAEWKSWLLTSAASSRVAPRQLFIRQIDVTASDAPERLLRLVEEMGGMDMYIHSSGIGFKNMALDGRIERETVITNALGFTQMVDAAFDWFKERGGGHIAFISSVAGTKGLGAAPSYSATKRYQWIYAQALAQLSSMERYNISFTDIRPGFVATGFLGSSKYPLLLEKHYVAQNIVKAILARKRSVIIDYKYKILCLFWRMIPNWLWERITNIKS